MSKETHYVYRVYNSGRELLYVGCTWQPRERLWQHATNSPWRHEAASVEVDGPMSHRAALNRERELIWSLGPVYNRPHPCDLYDFGLNADCTPLRGRAA